MSDELTLVFRVGDEPFPIPARVEEVTESPHTGKPIRRLSSDITVPAPRARSIAALLRTPRLVAEDGDEWSGHLEAESYRDVQGLHSLRIVWTELERLQADAVEFEGLSLHPLRYEERAEERGVALAFRARLSQDETDLLRQLQDRPRDDVYFPVVRRGISDEPRRMRLGRVLWQARPEGDIEHDITLVDAVYDETPTGAFKALGGEPQVGHLLDVAEQLAGERNALLDALRDAGVIDEAAIRAIRQSGADARGKQRYQFFEVANLSDWD